MTPQEALKDLCSTFPFSPDPSRYNGNLNHLFLDEIYSALENHDLDSCGALLTYLNDCILFPEEKCSGRLLSIASSIVAPWNNSADTQFKTDMTNAVREALLSVKAIKSWESGENDKAKLNSSWLFNLILIMSLPVFDFFGSFLNVAKGGEEEKEYKPNYGQVFHLAISNRWALVALMAICRYVSRYDIAKLDNSMANNYKYVLDHEDWLMSEATKISVDMESTTAWFFYMMKTDVLSRGIEGKTDAAKEAALQFRQVATQIPVRRGFHSSDYRMAKKMSIVPVVEHLLNYWLKQEEFGIEIQTEEVYVGLTDNYSDLDAIYKKAFSGRSEHAKWARELIAMGLQEHFGQNSIRWESGYAVTGDRVIIVSEFDEIEVAKELMADKINSICFACGYDGDYKQQNKIKIASISFDEANLPLIHKLIVGSTKRVIESNYKALLSAARGTLLDINIDGVGNLAELTLCDRATIHNYCNVSAY